MKTDLKCEKSNQFTETELLLSVNEFLASYQNPFVDGWKDVSLDTIDVLFVRFAVLVDAIGRVVIR